MPKAGKYLRILHLAASTMETDVEAALMVLLKVDEAISSDAVKALVATVTPPSVPQMAPLGRE